MEPSHREERILTLLCLGGYFFIGSLATLFPSILPDVLRGFGLRLAAVGLIFPASSVGGLMGGVLAGIGSDRIGRKPFMWGSALLSGLGLLGAYTAHRWPLFVGCFLVLGIAQGALSNSINALVLDLHSLRRGTALNALHGLYSLGATVSPFCIQWALGPTRNWRAVLLALACVWLALSLAALGFPYPSANPTGVQRRTFLWTLLGNGLFGMCFTIAFLYNGVAWALLGWIKESLQQGGVKTGLASSMISVFYLGLTAGRLACASFSERLGYGKTLLLCAVGTSVAYPLATFSQRPVWFTSGVLLSGLFLSGLYPTALASATRLFPAIPGTVTGMLSLAMTLGGALPPWWTGVLGSAWSLSSALRFNYLLVLPLLGIGLYVLRHERDVEAERALP
jgi:FHS family glucose/mannose:H+ symporter-like MFS transporter